MDAKNHSLFHLILQLRKLEHREVKRDFPLVYAI